MGITPINVGRQAIQTKFMGPTDTKGARIKAKALAGQVTISWDHAQSVEANHARAAIALAKRMGWEGRMIGGCSVDGQGDVYVFTSD